ncbi:MAG: pseudouridine synthase [Alphaproteobacteria bacterium]
MTEEKQQGERIAKYLARLGVASRRGAEKLIEEGRIKVNGKILNTAAFKVSEADEISFDNQVLGAKKETKLYRYYKPRGLVVSHRDEKGRKTVFDELPKELGRVISVGRLDLNSEGLLLLTNDGELARHLELPSTGWTRKYKVRAFGRLTEKNIAELKKGIKIDGIQYGSVDVKISSEQGRNFWAEVTLKEGKNREIRKIFAHYGCEVSRLIRLSFGAFRLAKLQAGHIEEISGKMMKEQLGAWNKNADN